MALAGSEHLRNLIRARLKAHHRRHEDIGKKWAADEMSSTEAEAIYYSSWYLSAIHILVSIPAYDTVKKISARLRLTEETTQDALHQLSRLGIIENRNNRWRTGSKSIHLAKQALMAETHHSSWRQRAILNTQNKDNWSVHYSSVFAISRADAEHLRKRLLDFIVEERKNIEPSPEEEIFCFNADFFSV